MLTLCQSQLITRQFAGCRVAGNPGTAHKLVNGPYAKESLPVFVGFAPVSDQRIIIALTGAAYTLLLLMAVRDEVAKECLVAQRITQPPPSATCAGIVPPTPERLSCASCCFQMRLAAASRTRTGASATFDAGIQPAA
jgi:hypothetical protein